MEVVQRWSEFGDYSWGFLEGSIFYPLHASSDYVDRVWKEIRGEYKPGYFHRQGWLPDNNHFVFKVHPSELPADDPKRFVVVPKPKATEGRLFRED